MATLFMCLRKTRNTGLFERSTETSGFYPVVEVKTNLSLPKKSMANILKLLKNSMQNKHYASTLCNTCKVSNQYLELF